jgi:hypothetical protein
VIGDDDIDIKKGVALLTAIARYAETYTVYDETDPAALAQTRKETLEALIDATTDRSAREGDWVLSVGANVGVAPVAWQDTASLFDTSSPVFTPAVGSLSMGFAAQWLPEEFVGFHSMIYLFDLGQYLFIDEDELALGDVSWRNAFTVGVQVGATFMVGNPNTLFTLSGFLQYSPTIPGGDTGYEDFRQFGVLLSYYVPFFDLN